jgi:hypothetical protein
MGYVFVRTCKLAAIVRPANGCTLIIKKRKKKGGPQSRKERQISRFRGLESNDVDGEAAVKDASIGKLQQLNQDERSLDFMAVLLSYSGPIVVKICIGEEISLLYCIKCGIFIKILCRGCLFA